MDIAGIRDINALKIKHIIDDKYEILDVIHKTSYGIFIFPEVDQMRIKAGVKPRMENAEYICTKEALVTRLN